MIKYIYSQLYQAYIRTYVRTHVRMYIHTCLLLISMLWLRQAIFESKRDKLPSSVECRIRNQGLRHLFPSRLDACWQTDWAFEDQAKTWTRQPVPIISKHSAHSTSLPVGFRTWLWHIYIHTLHYITFTLHYITLHTYRQTDRHETVLKTTRPFCHQWFRVCTLLAYIYMYIYTYI